MLLLASVKNRFYISIHTDLFIFSQFITGGVNNQLLNSGCFGENEGLGCVRKKQVFFSACSYFFEITLHTLSIEINI